MQHPAEVSVFLREVEVEVNSIFEATNLQWLVAARPLIVRIKHFVIIVKQRFLV